PFDGKKSGRVWRCLRQSLGRRLQEMAVRTDRAANADELRLVHSEDYLAELRSSSYVANVLEVPAVRYWPHWIVNHNLLRPLRWATRGTILAAQEALEHGFAVNLGGGFHHARPDRGEGFSVYQDIGIAVRVLVRDGKIDKGSRIVYIDTDAHQGNGVCHTFRDDKNIYIFDVFNYRIYPAFDKQARRRVNCPVSVDFTWTGSDYLEELKLALPAFLDYASESPVAFAIYNAGYDVYRDDPLGGLQLSAEAIKQRDVFVVEELRRRGIPTMMVLSGGYTPDSHQLVVQSLMAIISEGLQ
ncbi:MAG: histone deacetylase, partial [Planctomycetales bacterium]|nr:histone deacetylase [Planctomycetales bacterium]